jgi:hypothetical protein
MSRGVLHPIKRHEVNGMKRVPRSLPRQRGEFEYKRLVIITAVLLAMLVVPLWLWKDRETNPDRAQATAAAETAQVKGQVNQTPAPVTQAANNPDRTAVSFAWAAPPADAAVPEGAPARIQANCQGEPVPTERPLQGSCNPVEGDTSCRSALPVLCVRGQGDALVLGQTQPVAGFVLASAEAANARCAQELGADWRLARFQEPNSLQILGEKSASVREGLRLWAQVEQQRSHCWDPTP